MKTYLVQTKSDDYGACVTELVETTQVHAAEYYYSKEVPAEDVEILKKYLDFVDAEEEAERNDEQRFYGYC